MIESAAVIAEGGYIEPAQLPSKITGLFSQWGRTDIKLPSNLSLDERLMEVERGLIIEALSKTGGVQSRATELLGINQRSLWHRIKKLHIDVKSLKNQRKLTSSAVKLINFWRKAGNGRKPPALPEKTITQHANN